MAKVRSQKPRLAGSLLRRSGGSGSGRFTDDGSYQPELARAVVVLK